MSIRNLPVEDLIQRINDNVDLSYFPLGEIKSVDDEDQWDRVSGYLLGSQFFDLMKEGMPERARWFSVDTEQMVIHWFESKEDILRTLGEETIEDYLED